MAFDKVINPEEIILEKQDENLEPSLVEVAEDKVKIRKVKVETSVH